jgi:hypothetical protein
MLTSIFSRQYRCSINTALSAILGLGLYLRPAGLRAY